MIDGPEEDLRGSTATFTFSPGLSLSVALPWQPAILSLSLSHRRVSTVTDPLSFISVARETQPRLIDGISALPQQRGWEVGLLAIDFSTPPPPPPPLPHLQTPTSPAHTHTLTLYPYLPPISHPVLAAAAAAASGCTFSCMHTDTKFLFYFFCRIQTRIRCMCLCSL